MVGAWVQEGGPFPWFSGFGAGTGHPQTWKNLENAEKTDLAHSLTELVQTNAQIGCAIPKYPHFSIIRSKNRPRSAKT